MPWLTGHERGGPSGIQPPRTGFRQRRPSLSKEGSHFLTTFTLGCSPQRLVLSRMCSSMRVSISDAPLNMSEKSPPI